MKLAGMQKLTLLDFPGKMACIIFTAGCNFKCPFCHNASLVNAGNADSIDEDEVLDFLQKRKGMLEGVVITGGEPLLHSDIDLFLGKIKDLGYAVKLDTNGTNPALLKKLVKEKLVDYVAVDIKNSPEKYKTAVGNINLNIDDVSETKEFLLKGTVDYEFRTTLVKGIHCKEDMLPLVQWIKGAKNYYIQQYKHSNEVLSPDGLSEFSKEEIDVIFGIGDFSK